MIRRHGPRHWTNVHVTKEANIADLIDIDNTSQHGPQPIGFSLLRQAANDIDGLINEANQQGRRLRALGSGWALTDIAITDGWLLNTKLLNGCFDISTRYFEDSYPEAKRPYVVIAQCGISVAELNTHLEVTATSGFKRALKTSGIGAGQTIAGAISGNTHGAAVNFGATPDYVVGIQLVTGQGEPLWIERASQPVLNVSFAEKLESRLIRDDSIFNAALVSFGSFGIISALAIETDPIYHLKFPPVNDIDHDDLKHKLNNFDSDDPEGLYHYEFIFDPYSSNEIAMEAAATRVNYESGFPPPQPVWLVRNDKGFAPGDNAAAIFASMPAMTPAQKTALQFRQYREKCILDGVRGTPGQLFTATISYFEGFTESAFGVSINDASRTMEVATDVIKRLKIPAMSQVRMVHPSSALLGFTYLGPKTVIFEFGIAHNSKYITFENELVAELSSAGIRYTFHWSKNSGINRQRLIEMYGESRVSQWIEARRQVFQGNEDLMRVFSSDHLVRTGLDGP